jgi:two-component system, NtrC family, sensor kinase
LIEPAYHAKGVMLKASDAPPVLVWADAEKIHQVLVNLLTNALAATTAGGHVTVTVATRPASTEEQERASGTGQFDLDTMVTLTVCDSGCGMPQEDMTRAFQPFFTTKAPGRGTGLGLFLSREAVVAHGGQLVLDSEVGVGTTVTVVLPGLRSDIASV